MTKNKKTTNRKNQITVLAVIVMVLINIFIVMDCWKVNREINLLSGNISELADIKTTRLGSANIRDKSVFDVEAAGYYYSSQGDQLGVGPMPPAVGTQTTIWIFWEVDRLDKDIQSFVMSGRLPDNVVYTGNKSLMAGVLRYEPGSKEITWLISDLESDIFRAGFEVSISPQTDDDALNFMTDICYNAGSIQGRLDDITIERIRY